MTCLEARSALAEADAVVRDMKPLLSEADQKLLTRAHATVKRYEQMATLTDVGRANLQRDLEAVLKFKQAAVRSAARTEPKAVEAYAKEVAEARPVAAAPAKTVKPPTPRGFETQASEARWYAQGRTRFTPAEQDTLGDWVELEYTQVVAGLRAGTVDVTSAQVKALDDVIEKLSLDRPLTVYRGVDMPDWAGKLRVGDEVTDTAWAATATRRQFMDDWTRNAGSPVELRIHLAKGQKYTKPELFSDAAEEMLEDGASWEQILSAGEVLLPRDTTLRVIAGHQETHAGQTRWVYDVEVV